MKATLVIQDDGKPDEFLLDLRASNEGKKLSAYALITGLSLAIEYLKDAHIETRTKAGEAKAKEWGVEELSDDEFCVLGVSIPIEELNVIGTHHLNQTEAN